MPLTPFVDGEPRALRTDPVPAILVGVLVADAMRWPRSEAPTGVEGDPAELIRALEIGEDGLIQLKGGPEFEHVGTLEARETVRGGAGGLDDELALRIAGLLGLESSAIVGPVVPKALEQSKFIGFIPETHLAEVSAAVFQAGAGRIGDYTQCSFQTPGTGTFRAPATAKPFTGDVETDEVVPEVRFETVCPHHALTAVIRAYLRAHPYETPAYDVVELTTPGSVGAGRVVQLDAFEDAASLCDRLGSELGFDDVWLPSEPTRLVHVAATVGPLAELIPALVHERPRVADLVICGVAEEWEVEVVRALGAAVATILPPEIVPSLRSRVAARLTRQLGLAVSSTGVRTGAADEAPMQSAQTALPLNGSGTPPGAAQPRVTSVQLAFDGGSRGNPGPAAGAFVIFDAHGTELERRGVHIGRATNNVAEWTGLLQGLQRVVELGAEHVAIRGDSQLAIRQLNGEYRVKHPDLQPLHAAALRLLARLQSWSADHVPRAQNAEADGLVNETLDAGRNLP